MRGIFVSLSSNSNKSVQKQKDILLPDLKQLESRHKLNPVTVTEQKIRATWNQLVLLVVNHRY